MNIYQKITIKVFCILSLISIGVDVSAQISGIVFADYNASGTRTTSNPNEPLVAGVIVTAYDAMGTVLASYTTTSASAPNYNIPASSTAYNGTLGSNTGFVASGTVVRIEFSNLPSYAYTSANGSANLSSVQFVTAPSTTTSFGINNPGDYFTNNPLVITPLYINGNNAGTQNVLVGLNYDESGSVQNIAKANEIGSTWGVAYKPSTKTIYAAAVLKRHNGFGPGADGTYGNADDISTIYVFNNYSGTGAGTVTAKIDLNSFAGVNVGANPRVGTTPANDLGGITSPSHDYGVYGNEGKRGIGDIDLSEDGQTLYVLNLNTPSLVVLNVSNPNLPTLIGNYPINKPSGAPASDTYRPWAIGVNNGKVYVGGVMSADVTQDVANLRAYVQEFTGGAFTTVDIDGTSANDFLPLNYNRSSTYFYAPSSGWINAEWRAWTDVESATFPAGRPQPILSDIDFSENGAMILSFLDRNGLQVGNNNYAPTQSNTGLYAVIIGGELRQICNTGTVSDPVYAPEGTTGCTQNITPNSRIDAPSDPPSKRYFNTVSYANTDPANFAGHGEIPFGGLAYLKGSNSLVITAMNPEDIIDNGGTTNQYFSGGLRWFRENGTTLRNYTLYNTGGSASTTATNAKSVGLGDIEFYTPIAPIEIGNRVWDDIDKDGIQDANEAGIAGITVQLFLASNMSSPVATATTDATGNYYFSSATGTSTASVRYGIVFTENTNYVLKFPTTTGGKLITGVNTGSNDLIDSDANIATGEIAFTVGSAGQNDHSFDVGYFTCVTPTATASATQPNCTSANAPNNGGITITGFTAGQRYQYSTGTTFNSGAATPATITAIPTGGIITSTLNNTTQSYTVRIYDASGDACFIDRTVNINSVEIPTITAGSNICVGSTITLTGSGTPAATNPYISTNNAIATVTSDGIVTGISAGTTTITYTNSVGCSANTTVTINPLPAANAGMDVTVTCATPSTTLTASGGDTYVWSNGANSANTIVSPTTTTTYTVTVTGSNGCTLTDTVLVTANKTAPIFTVNKTDITCNGAGDGSITIYASGGLPPYEYSINNGTTFQSANIFSNLTPAPYIIKIKDANGCEVTCQ